MDSLYYIVPYKLRSFGPQAEVTITVLDLAHGRITAPNSLACSSDWGGAG